MTTEKAKAEAKGAAERVQHPSVAAPPRRAIAIMVVSPFIPCMCVCVCVCVFVAANSAIRLC